MALQAANGAALGVVVCTTPTCTGAEVPVALTCDDPACTVGVAPPSGSLTPGQEAAIAHAIALSQERFPEAPSNVTQGMAVIATVENFADALAGTGLLGPRPLLLTGGTTLH